MSKRSSRSSSTKSSSSTTLTGAQVLERVSAEKAERAKELIQRGFIVPLVQEGWEGDVSLNEGKVSYYCDEDLSLLLPLHLISVTNEEHVKPLKQIKGVKVHKVHTNKKGYITRVEVSMY